MATMIVKIEPDTVAHIVARIRPYLKRDSVHDNVPEIVEDAMHLEEDWWYIPVRLTQPGLQTYQYYDMLSEIEEDIKQRENLKVLFVPAN